jgi:hypothetical protein
MQKRIPLTVLLALVLTGPVLGWHKDGHMAIARIAWQQLDDKEKSQLIKILKAHVHDGIDHYKVFLVADRPQIDGEAMDEFTWAFARAAAWPDWVRNPRIETPDLKPAAANKINKTFHHGEWHFINLPFIHPKDGDQFDASDLRKKVLEPAFTKKNGKDDPRHALAALQQSVAILQSDANDADKAVALCWLLHLIGDIHQPLHASALVARAESLPKTNFDPPPAPFDPPEGDAGGNRLAIKLKATNTDAEVLHAYWDALVFRDAPDFAKVEHKVQVMLKTPKYQPNQLPELAKKDYLDWAEESLDLAKTVAYRVEGTKDSDFLNATPLPITKSEMELKAALRNLKAPALSSNYQQRANDVAERRMVLAGYRLAEQIKKALQPAN